MSVTIYQGDASQVLRTLPAESVHSVITSPPYFAQRDYGVVGQLGLEPTPDEYVRNLVSVFAEVKRVLRRDGQLWLVLADTYVNGKGHAHGHDPISPARRFGKRAVDGQLPGLKRKDLIGIPWRVALALQADGWYLRSEIIWVKTTPMPESAKDRPTNNHEKIFLLSKQSHYFYDADAIREPLAESSIRRLKQDIENQNGSTRTHGGLKSNGPMKAVGYPVNGRNRRAVWSIYSKRFAGAHFATFPEELVKICLKAGTSEHGCCANCGAPYKRQTETEFVPRPDVSLEAGRKHSGQYGWDDTPRGHNTIVTKGWAPTCKCNAAIRPCTVLDPFAGAGTTGLAAWNLGRDATLIELNSDYVDMAVTRINGKAPLFAPARRRIPAWPQLPAKTG